MIKSALLKVVGASSAALLLAQFSGAIARDWVSLRPADSTFSVSMPGQPQVMPKTLNPPSIGKIDINEYILVDPGHAIYQVQDARFEQPIPAGADHMKILEAIERSFAATSKATIVSSTRTQMQGHPALIMMLQRGDVYIRGFTLTAGDHNFVVIGAAKQDAINSDELTRFLSSFKVLG